MVQTMEAATFMQRIAAEFDSLSKQLKVIATYIEQNQQTMMLQRITDIAAACEVQPSAVVRFAQRFGFAGFSDMQAVFRDAFSPQAKPPASYQQRIRSVISDGQASMSGSEVLQTFIAASQYGLASLADEIDQTQFEQAVELLQQAENIYVVGVRRMFPVASYLTYALQHTQKRVHLLSGLGGMYHEQIRSIRANDLLIAISFQPYGRESRYCARVATQHQARLLVITDSQLSPLVRNADACLTVREGNAFAFRSLSSTFCLCQALFTTLAFRLELSLEEPDDKGGYDD